MPQERPDLSKFVGATISQKSPDACVCDGLGYGINRRVSGMNQSINPAAAGGMASARTSAGIFTYPGGKNPVEVLVGFLTTSPGPIDDSAGQF